MNNIFYEFLEKNNLQDVILDIPINENFNLPFVDKKALQPLRIDLVMYPVKINNVIYNCYISSVPKPILYFTLKKSKAILDIATQEQILQALVSVVNKTLVKDKDYIIVKSPKTLPPTGKGSIVGDAISWKKGVWQFIRMAIEKGSKTNVQSDVKIDVKTSASAGSTGSTASSDSSSGQFDAKVIKIYPQRGVIGLNVLSDKISIGNTIEITKDSKKIFDKIVSIQISGASVDSASKGQTCGVKFENNDILSKLSEGDLLKIKKESNSVTQGATNSTTQANPNDANQSSSKKNNSNKTKFEIALESENVKNLIEIISKMSKDSSKFPSMGAKFGFENYGTSIKKDLPAYTKDVNFILKEYEEIKKDLKSAGYTGDKVINQFIDDYKKNNQDKAESFNWFYENYVNNHFTMKRIFNS